jgi:hypothetical protein
VSVPVSPGVLYPQPDLQPQVRDYPIMYDFLNDGTGRVVTTNPAGHWGRGQLGTGGAVNLTLPPLKTMREPGTYDYGAG